MISALSGNGGLALLSLFGRPKSQATAEASPQFDSRAGASSTSLPPDAARGTPPESLFAALVDQTGRPADLSAQAVSALDRDGSGTLNSAELMQAYQGIAGPGTASSVSGLVSNIIGRLDGDGDGAISPTELTSAVSSLSAAATTGGDEFDSLLNQVMRQLDADGNGLTRAEVAAALGMETGALPQTDLGIESRPTSAPQGLYEAIFSMRVNPEGGEATEKTRETIAARLRDALLG